MNNQKSRSRSRDLFLLFSFCYLARPRRRFKVVSLCGRNNQSDDRTISSVEAVVYQIRLNLGICSNISYIVASVRSHKSS
jgi:hypothetical protein